MDHVKEQYFYLTDCDKLVIDLLKISLKHSRIKRTTDYFEIYYQGFRITCFNKFCIDCEVIINQNQYGIFSHSELSPDCGKLIGKLMIDSDFQYTVLQNNNNFVSNLTKDLILALHNNFMKKQILLETL